MASQKRKAHEDDDLETQLIAALEAQAAADEEAALDDDLLVLEGEDFPPEPAKQRRMKPILGGPDGPRNLRELAMLERAAEAAAEDDDDDGDIVMTDTNDLPAQLAARSTGKAVSHRATYANQNPSQDEIEPQRDTKSGKEWNRMLPLRPLGPSGAGMRSSAVFNHRVTKPRVAKEKQPSSSRPVEFWEMTDVEYAEHLKKEKEKKM